MVFSVSLYASEQVYYLQSTLQETTVGSGIYIIQGTDGQWYQVNGQEDLGNAEFIKLPGPPGWDDVADKVAEVGDKIAGVDRNFQDRWGLVSDSVEGFVPDGDINSSDVPVWMNGINVGTNTYLYARITDSGITGVYRTLITSKSDFSVKIIDSKALYGDYMCPLSYSFNGCSAWELVSGSGGYKPWLHDSGYECGIRKERSFQFWSNSASVGSKMSASLGNASSLVGKYPDSFPEGIDSDSIFTQPIEDIEDEQKDGLIPGEITVTHSLNVKVTNFDELVSKLEKLKGDGVDPESWFKYLENNSLWEDEEEEANFNQFIDKSMYLLGVKEESTFSLARIGDEIVFLDAAEDDVEDVGVSILIYPIQIVYKFLSSLRDVEKSGQFNFPEIEISGSVLLEETEFNFYQFMYDNGFRELYDIYLIVTNGILTLSLVYFAKERVGQFMQGRKGDIEHV